MSGWDTWEILGVCALLAILLDLAMKVAPL